MTVSTTPASRDGMSQVSPPAVRRRATSWRDPRLAVGIVLVAASALIGALLLGGEERTTGVWAAARPLTSGQPLAEADLVRREVGFAEQADADRYLSADAAPPSGLLGRDVGPGELLPRAAVEPERGVSLFEVPVTVDAGAVPLTVRVGTRVDVWVTPDPSLAAGDETPESTPAFRSVVVLALSRGGGALGPSPTRQVVLGVPVALERTLPRALAEIATGSVVLVRAP